jgi:hypothetical protein
MIMFSWSDIVSAFIKRTLNPFDIIGNYL